MKIALRLGIFRDRAVLEQEPDLAPAIVVPAHIAAYSQDGLWGFLRGIAEAKGLNAPPFFYDPMTYWFDIPAQFWSRGSESRQGNPLTLPVVDLDDIRPAFKALLDRYGMTTAVQSATSGPQFKREFIETGVGAALDFQREGSTPKGKKTVDKYAEILGLALSPVGMTPERLVAPYFSVPGVDPTSLVDQAALNAKALAARREGEEMWAVLAVESSRGLNALPPASAQALALDKFDGVGVWVSDLDEHESSLEALQRYRALVSSLGLPVWIMYGGYFSLLLADEGVATVSHGIYYTESKKLRGPVGSGPAPERYYVPALHRFYTPAAAFALLRRIPTLACTCPVCGPGVDDLIRESAAAAASAAARMAWIRRLQQHFLFCRAAEVKAVTTRERSELLDELQNTSAAVRRASGPQLAALSVSAAHLDRWLTALT